MDSFTPSAATELAYRQALGRFATGVTVVTAAGTDGPVGMTVNSFTSVSLDPALVLWCPAKSSHRFSVFHDADFFALHVLTQEQQALSEHFASPAPEFDGLDWSQDDQGVPHLHGTLARFQCRRNAVHDAGDHVIVVGEVLQAAQRPGRPLVFSGGGYQVLAP